MKIRVKKLTDTAKMPTRGSASAAGYDLYADVETPVEIEPHATVMVGTGLSMEIPEGYFGAIFARSGLAAKESLRPANCVGVVDADYRGPFMIAVHNDGETARRVTPGERIAQLVILPFLPAEFEEVEQLGETERGEGGFGSTGKS
ncbi:dUTP diphosphatase [Bilifractor sp. LCP19S3_H10]|uniref:dUTP diphosphatase n=1 Tax=Bilifractor sp. LCP19S3_H10 TaxID=3438736 RepID=UPI003F8D99E0